jgi:hypothetical protein
MTTLTKNTTTNVVIGSSITDLSIKINFIADRKSMVSYGEIIVSCPFTDFIESTPVVKYFGNDAGITFTADISGANIRLNCIVDNSYNYDVSFSYKLSIVTTTKVSSVGVRPDALFDSRTSLQINASIGSQYLTIERFPYLYLYANPTSQWSSVNANNSPPDFSVILIYKGTPGANNNLKINGIFGTSGDYMYIYESGGNVSINCVIGGTFTISPRVCYTAAEFYSDFRIFGFSYEGSTRKMRFIGGTSNLYSEFTINNTTPVPGTTAIYLSEGGTTKHNIIAIASYTRSFSTTEITNIFSNILPGSPINDLVLFNNDHRYASMLYAREVIDSVTGNVSIIYSQQNTDMWDYKTNNLFAAYSLLHGFTQRDTHQIAYLPDDTKSISLVTGDYECISTGVIHNMANSYINGNPANHSMVWSNDDDKIYAIWDKSNRIIWKSSIETANLGEHYRLDDNGNYTLWHPQDELNQTFISQHAQPGHDGHILVQLRFDVNNNITGIERIATYKESLT